MEKSKTPTKREKEQLETEENKKIIDALKTIQDPELRLDIWTLGLVYNIEVQQPNIKITMTFTSMMCPFGPQLVENVKSELKQLDFKEVNVEVVFNPPWEPSEDVKMILGLA